MTPTELERKHHHYLSRWRRHRSPVRLPVRGDVCERERDRDGVGVAQIPNVSKRHA